MEPEPIFPGFEEVALPQPSGVPNLHNSDFVWPEKIEKMNHGLAKVLPPGHMSPTVGRAHVEDKGFGIEVLPDGHLRHVSQPKLS